MKLWLHVLPRLDDTDTGCVNDTFEGAFKFNSVEEAEEYLREALTTLREAYPKVDWRVEESRPFFVICGEEVTP